MPARFDHDAYMDAWRQNDIDRVCEHYAEDAEFWYPLLDQPVRGKDNCRGHWEAFGEAFGDLQFETVEEPIQEGNRIAAVYLARAKQRAPFHTPEGGEAGRKGKDISFLFARVAEIDEEGKIRREHMIFDTANVGRQLEVAQAMAPGQEA